MNTQLDALAEVKVAVEGHFRHFSLGDTRLHNDAESWMNGVPNRVTWDQIRALVARCEAAEAEHDRLQRENQELAEARLLADWEAATLRTDLALNATMLARQCDLAREAEAESARLRALLRRVEGVCLSAALTGDLSRIQTIVAEAREGR